MKKIIIILALMVMVSVASAEAWVDNDTYFLGSKIWYRFYENYNITGKLIYIDDNFFNINKTYIFNITPDSERCNATLITLNVSQVEWNLTCGAGVSSVYHVMGSFPTNRFLYIKDIFNVTLIPIGEYVSFNYSGGFRTVLFRITSENNPPVAGTPTLVVSDYVTSAHCYNTTFTDLETAIASFYYLFWVNGILIQDSNSSRLDDSHFVQGDRIICGIIPWDGYDNGTSVNSSEGQVGSWDPGGGGGGPDFPTTTTTIPPPNPFTIIPRAIDPILGNIPSPILLKRGETVERVIINNLNINLPISITIKGYEYITATDYEIKSEDMIVISLQRNITLLPRESVILKIVAEIPEDAIGRYEVELIVSTDLDLSTLTGDHYSPPREEVMSLGEFIISPRTLDLVLGDIPAPVYLYRDSTMVRTITNNLNETHTFLVSIKGFEYETATGYKISSEEMIEVIPLGNIILQPGESKEIMIISRIPEDAINKYKVSIEVTEII